LLNFITILFVHFSLSILSSRGELNPSRRVSIPLWVSIRWCRGQACFFLSVSSHWECPRRSGCQREKEKQGLWERSRRSIEDKRGNKTLRLLACIAAWLE
jgi:hypothetical protein